jgi:two-component system, chemotaxis family, CheB/CheR fusion protein
MEEFKEIDAKLKIFRRSGASLVSELLDFPSSFHHKNITTEKSKPVKPVENIQSVAEQILLQRFTPASVLVNEHGDILYISGRTGKFLEPVAGKANWNIHAMAREGLRQVLPGGFRKASLNFDPIVIKSVKIGSNGDSQLVDVTIQRIESANTTRILIMVVFKVVPFPIETDISKIKSGKQGANTRIAELEVELQRSFEELQSTREEMQTSQEELKSTNEELQSTNEELQSTNEELTTSKEEMQSLNEELQTVNVELQSKVSDYIRASDDMKNLLNSTGIATLFLDRDLNIRRFTDQVTRIVKLRDADIGRPITDLVTDLDYPELHDNARQVIKTLSSIETAHTTHDGRWFNVRIMPYRTLDDRIDGLVLTFTDITEAKRLEAELKESEQIFREMIEKSPDACLINDFTGGKDLGILEGNQAALQLLGMNSKSQLLATRTNSLSPEQQPDGKFSNVKYTDMIAKALVNGSNRFEWVYSRVDGKPVFVEVNMSVIDSLGKKLLHTFIREIPPTF